MTACQTLGQSLSASSPQPAIPQRHFLYRLLTITKFLTYRPIIDLSLYDEVLRRSVEITLQYRPNSWRRGPSLQLYKPSLSATNFSALKMSVELANSDSASYAVASNGLCR